jgi:2-oxoisovalerate dehydrogenase E1 component
MAPPTGAPAQTDTAGGEMRRVDRSHRPDAGPSKLVGSPHRLPLEEVFPYAYQMMYLSRRLDERLLELFQKGYVRGTVTQGTGNEATAVAMALPFRPGRDVVSFLHRDLASHLVQGMTPYEIVCQYMANADSPTQGREGNVHHGDASRRRYPMMSHLGQMLPVVVGATWGASATESEIRGLAVIGDGGTSTGEFHESLNIASVFRIPVLFVVENNYLAFSTPISAQYACRQISDRAPGYAMPGKTIDGTDFAQVYNAVWDAVETMQREPGPYLLECMTLRLHGHAAYDKAEYVTEEQQKDWNARDPVPKARRQLRDVMGYEEEEIAALEAATQEQVESAISRAMPVRRVQVRLDGSHAFAVERPPALPAFTEKRAKNGDAVRLALDYLLSHDPRAYLAGLDIGRYGSAFKTCKGLIDRFGADRVIDMPLGESGIIGFALGSAQTGARPIVEFQFADFATEAATQIGLNAGTWHFRAGQPAPLLLRLPCGGGLTMGAFHSGEFEGLWSRFAGLKVLYPATAQETFEALVAGFYDPNPCLVMEHKLLYWSKSGPIEFDGDVRAVWRCRQYTEGRDLTVVALGAMVHEALAASAKSPHSLEVWNPFVLRPLDTTPIAESVKRTGRLLVVQEAGESQGLGHEVISRVVSQGVPLSCPPKLLARPDLPVPFAPELEMQCRPDTAKILAAVEHMCETK